MLNYCDDLSFVNYGYSGSAQAGTSGRLFEGYYGIQFLQRGGMIAHTGEHPPEFAEGPAVFITFPGIPFHYGSPPGQIRAQAYVCFRGDRVARYCESGLLELRETQLFRQLRNPEAFFRTMLSLHQLLKIPGEVPHIRAVLLLEELLLQIQEQPSVPGRLFSHYMKKLLDLRDRIAMDPLKDWNFPEEARKLELSYVHFRRIFKQATGWPPGAFLLECRLRHAEKLLMSSHDRIGEIAWQCGFQDVYHFSRIFKKHSNHSPAEYRRLFGSC